MQELKNYAQWILWRRAMGKNGKPTKEPISAKWLGLCDPTNITSCVDFDSALAAYNARKNEGLIHGLGFCLMPNDPFCFIDLDKIKTSPHRELQKKIYNLTKSYVEYSPSGEGLHIICKADVPSGRKRNDCEIYSNNRFMTMTGNACRDVEIHDENELCNYLWAHLESKTKTAKNTQISTQQKQLIVENLQSDDQVISFCTDAANGEKFKDLYENNWQIHYDSHSEADFALINIIAYYTNCMQQVKRIFLNSALAQRQKSQTRDKYVDDMIERSFDRKTPPINFDQLKRQFEQINAKKDNESKNLPALLHELKPKVYEFKPPGGLIGQVYDYIYKSAQMPLEEVALGSAFALIAGLAGRAYNVHGGGLNLYIMICALTGTGKSYGKRAVDNLINTVDKISNLDASEYLGPTEITSAQGTIKALQSQPSIACFWGELGKKLNQMYGARVSPQLEALAAVLLDVYQKSGKGNQFGAARYSKKENDVEAMTSPALTLCGEGNPANFFGALTEDSVEDGLLPRVWILQNTSDRQRPNFDAWKVVPTNDLLSNLTSFVTTANTLNTANEVIDVELDDDAKRAIESYGVACDWRVNNAPNQSYRNMWTRAEHLALKLSALIAVGFNPFRPVVTASHILWATNEVNRSINLIADKIETGEIRQNNEEPLQLDNLKRVIWEYVSKAFKSSAYLSNTQSSRRLHADKVIPYRYIYGRLSRVACFARSKLGTNRAVDNCIRLAEAQGLIVAIDNSTMITKYNSRSKAYALADVEELSNNLN